MVNTQARGRKAREEILKLVRLRHANEGLFVPPPTVREIATAIGLSTATTHRHIGILVASGLLERVPGKARGIRPVQPKRSKR